MPDFFTVNEGNSLQEQIRQLNQMVLKLQGRSSKGEFNKNEIDNLYDQLAGSGFSLNRQYLRDVGLGNIAADYSDWSHIYAEAGYSIWKYPISNYSHSALNELYFNNKVLSNRGAAVAEAITSFDSVKLYNGDSASGYTTHTTEAATESGTEFEVMDSTEDYLYIGDASQFFGAKFEFQTPGLGYTLAFEYWNGSAWTDLEASALIVTDNTSDFASDGRINWDNPGDWATTSINGATNYWIRISTTTDPTRVAKAYLIIPDESAVALLALSSLQIISGEWAWCYFNNYIYVTIRNAGNSNYEGNLFITSSSSTTNKLNFFVYNNGNGYELNHVDSTYT